MAAKSGRGSSRGKGGGRKVPGRAKRASLVRAKRASLVGGGGLAPVRTKTRKSPVRTKTRKSPVRAKTPKAPRPAAKPLAQSLVGKARETAKSMDTPAVRKAREAAKPLAESLVRKAREARAAAKPLADSLLRKAREAQKAAKPFAESLVRKAREAQEAAKPFADSLLREARKAGEAAKPFADSLLREARKAREAAKPLAESLVREARKAGEAAKPLAESLARKARGAAKDAMEATGIQMPQSLSPSAVPRRSQRTPAAAARPGSAAGVRVLGRLKPGYNAILTPAALSFLAALERAFGPERRRLLLRRAEAQARLDRGEKPKFPPETQGIRDREWTVAPAPADLRNRRVEITGPTDRKMVINALNSGANVFLADFEDANTPSWDNLIEGQINLREAVAGAITYDDPLTAKVYRLGPKPAVLMVRPRGWHLEEAHVLVDGLPMSGALFDFGLYFFHNAKALLAKGSGPYFYLPKLENHLEARLWNQVFLHAQEGLKIPPGSVKATVLIETILAAFEMDEILWELRQHSTGLNCGRWDYIFSFIKRFRRQRWAVLPDRAQVTMTTPFLRAYCQLLVQVCHRRQAHAMGGMAAQIPIKDDLAANAAAMAKVRDDKEREAAEGFDGTWIAHPGLVGLARQVFDAHMPGPNQIARRRDDVRVSAADLLQAPAGTISEAGLRLNINVGIGYIEAWLRGIGCVPLHNLMEDAATAEISRAQVWQWRRYGARFADGRAVDAALIGRIIQEQLAAAENALGAAGFAAGRHQDAAALFRQLVEAEDFAEFLTLPAYDLLIKEGR